MTDKAQEHNFPEYDLEDSLINKVEVVNQPKLSIPKKIADALDTGDLMILAWTHANDLLGKVPDEERKTEIIRRNALARAYHAGKALGVELVEVSDE
ncbi:hypothetical protein VNN36_10110 [Lactococcus garvieae]|uniref:hypothetical protein n=1 Tax=Lactococcus garvieae TaxID=1363 RepID=UPI0030D457FD